MRRLTQLASVAAALLCFAAPASRVHADDVKVGDKAPVFSAKDDTGKEWKSADHVGKKIVVVYFYPADCTGGCTKQAIGFTKDAKTLADMNVEVVGVSGDSVSNHQLFKKKESLGITLLADMDGKVAEAFGVPFTPGEKSVKATIDGKEETLVRGVTTQRWTFIIGKDGKIAHKNDMVKAADDSANVISIVKTLK